VHLAVSAILLASGMDAEEAKLAETKSQAKSRKNGYRQDEDKSLEETRHKHHRDGLTGMQAAHIL
jgi:hypothetical protein